MMRLKTRCVQPEWTSVALSGVSQSGSQGTSSEMLLAAMQPYRVDAGLMAMAKSDAIFLHCLPAHVGDEVSADVFESGQSKVFDEAENRIHAQKSILLWSLGLI